MYHLSKLPLLPIAQFQISFSIAPSNVRRPCSFLWCSTKNIHGEVCLKNYRFYQFRANICFHYRILCSIINNNKFIFFKQIHPYTVSIQEISTICIDQMLTYLLWKKMRSVLGSEFSTVCSTVCQSS